MKLFKENVMYDQCNSGRIYPTEVECMNDCTAGREYIGITSKGNILCLTASGRYVYQNNHWKKMDLFGCVE